MQMSCPLANNLRFTVVSLAMGLVALVLLLHFSEGSPALMARFNEYNRDDLNWLIMDLGVKLRSEFHCLTLITDPFYNDLLAPGVFQIFGHLPVFKIKVKEYEDLLSPNFKTLSIIQQSRRTGCNAYIILIANGGQVARFLRFGDKNRVIDTRAMYLMLHDWRLFTSDLNYIWKKLVNVIFLRKFSGSLRYELSTVPFPIPVQGNLRPLRIDSWRAGKFQNNIGPLYSDKTSDLLGEVLHIAVFEHMPSVIKIPNRENTNDSNEIGAGYEAGMYNGLEIQIIISLSEAMNFRALVYEPKNADSEAWGQYQLNGTFSGLLGEVTTGRADIVLGNFLYSTYNLKLMDLSRPYITQCFTFLTPESTTDNSWKTLIAPFQLVEFNFIQ